MLVIDGLLRLVREKKYDLATPGLGEKLQRACAMFALSPRTVASYVDAVIELLRFEVNTGRAAVVAAQPSQVLAARKEPQPEKPAAT
jgi:hypothetical protein